MVVSKLIPPHVAASSVEEQLQYLYTRKQMLDRLILAMETYCESALPIPRKSAGNVLAGYILQSLAS